MAGDADANGFRVAELKRLVDHQLVGRIDVRLRRIRCERPVVHLGFDTLIGEVRSLDDADLRRGPALCPPPVRPLAQPLECRMRIGDVGLEHDPGREFTELIAVEHPHERFDAQLEVAVLLHVEVDEGARRGVARGTVEADELPFDPRQRVIPCEHVEVCADGGDLHAHVVDIGPADQLGDAAGALLRLVIAENRLAEHVHVEPEAIGLAPGQVLGEGRVVGREDDAGRVLVDAPGREALRRPGDERGDTAQGGEPEPVEPAERCRNAGSRQLTQPLRRPSWAMDSHDLVGEVEEEIAAIVVGKQARKAIRSGGLLRCRLRCLEDEGCSSFGIIDKGRVGVLDRHADNQTAHAAVASCAIMAAWVSN